MHSKSLFFILFVLVSTFCLGQNPGFQEKKKIIDVLSGQQKAWNEGNLDGFLASYWNSDTLRMVTPKGVTYGWDKIKQNYLKGYPDKAAMGELEFEIVNVDLINDLHAIVAGKWVVKQDKKFKGGYFSLVMKKMKGKWLIIADHTS